MSTLTAASPSSSPAPSPPSSPQSSRSTSSSYLSSTDTSTAPSTPGEQSSSLNPIDYATLPPPILPVTPDEKPLSPSETPFPFVSSTSAASAAPKDREDREDASLKTIRAGLSSLLSSSSSHPPPAPTPAGKSVSDPIVPLASSSASATTLPPPPPLLPRPTVPAVARRPRPGPGLKAGVRGSPGIGGMGGGMKIPPSLQATMAAMASRSSSSLSINNPPASSPSTPSSSSPSTTNTNSQQSRPSIAFRPPPSIPTTSSKPRLAPPPARKRPGLTLAAMGMSASGESGSGIEDRFGGMSVGGPGGQVGGNSGSGTPFANFSKIVDPSGTLTFASKAVIHAAGVDFSSGASFKIQMTDFELFEELGQGNYGTVKRVRHAKTGVVMALKEIRLELDDSKLKTIITELDILHRATSPYIIDFYGAFFIESCVYYCMEYMDAGSLDKVSGCDVREDVLARVTGSVVKGLKWLKDGLGIMHRDVKPTNVLINRQGFVKLCDFGVSGQLDKSLAKTNIGCQSYMAPERIQSESLGSPGSYTASSDVWSLGLSVIEFAIGHYPYPPETYRNVLAQLTAIVHGEPPTLPGGGEEESESGKTEEGEASVGKVRYSESARDFVKQCLRRKAAERPTYAQLLEHPFLKADEGREVDVAGWIKKAVEFREKYPRSDKAAFA